MIISIIIAGCCVLLPVGFITVLNYIAERNSTNGSPSFEYATKLTWKQIRDFYRLNHNKWRYEQVIKAGYSSLKSSYKVLLYNATGNWTVNSYEHTYKNKKQIVRIKMGPITSLKFHFNRLFNKKQMDVGMETILDSVQGDIDAIRDLSEKEIDEANDKMKEILTQMINKNNSSCELSI